LNVTIDRFVDATVSIPDSPLVKFVDLTTGEAWEGTPERALDGEDGGLALHRAVYRRFAADFNRGRPFPMAITTASETPAGSGLGASSTLVVAMVKALVEMHDLRLGRYDIARLAHDIERRDARLPGGRQDQYAAAFGGLNFLEFHGGDRVVVTPVTVDAATLLRLERSILLFHTGIARDSARIITEQQRRLAEAGACSALEAMHCLKANAVRMRHSLIRGDMDDFHAAVNESWEAKKQTAGSISNAAIETIHDAAMSAGARAAKVSGAGGGGFVVIFADPARRGHIESALRQFDGRVMPCRFAPVGAQAWPM
jgi:D-glycero-alpha-D-manno-heptose-7-phosphate kinase